MRQHPEADVEVEQPDAAQGGGAGLVEEVVGRVHRLVEADRGHRVAEPDERRLHGDLLDQQRQPTGGAQQAAYLVRLLGQVDLLSTGRADAAEEQLDGGSLQRGALGGHRQRSDADDGLGRLAGGRQRRHHHAGVAGRLEHRLEDRTGLRRVEVEAVEDEQALTPVDRAAEGTRQRVARRRLRLEALQGRDEHVVDRAQVAGVDPRGGRGRGRGDVAHEQRLAAAGRAHDGDPPRLLQRLVQRSLHVLTTETGGQHDTNLSLLRT